MLLLHLNTCKWYHLYVFSELFTVWCLYLDNQKPLLYLSPLSFFLKDAEEHVTWSGGLAAVLWCGWALVNVAQTCSGDHTNQLMKYKIKRAKKNPTRLFILWAFKKREPHINWGCSMFSGDWTGPHVQVDYFDVYWLIHLTGKLTNRLTHQELCLFKKRVWCIFNISFPVLSPIPPFASCLFVYECVCVTLSCEAVSQADSRACWQGNTAGRLITAHGRQALTGASPLLTSQWHQMLCVYSHVHVLVYMRAFAHVCTSGCVCACIFLSLTQISKINELGIHIHSLLIHPSNLCLSMGSASSWHCSILYLAALPTFNTRWQHVHTESIFSSISGALRLQWQCV